MPTLPVGRHGKTWFNEPAAVFDSGASYYGIYTDNGGVSVARYDHSLGILEAGNPRGTSTAPIQFDDHNNPSVLVERVTGRILAGYEHHPGPAWIARSPAARSVRGTWTETQVFDGTGTNYQSYSHFGQTTDDLNTVWQFFRHGQTVGQTMPITYRYSQDNGATWTAAGSVVGLIAKTSSRPYFRLAVNGRRIDFLYGDGNPGEEVTCNLYHLYLEMNTAGTQYDIRKSDGTLVDTFNLAGGTGLVNSKTLPLSVAEGTVVYNGATNRAWVWDCQWIGGSLYGAFVTFSQTTNADDTHRYHRCALSGGAWTVEPICYAGDSTTAGDVGRVPHWIIPDSPITSNKIYSPGVCLDPNDASIAYVGKKSATATVNLQKWVRGGGGAWTYDSAVTSDSGVVNCRPFPVLGSSPSNVVWMRAASYPSYDNYTGSDPGILVAHALTRTTKITSPAYTSTYAPNGHRAIYLANEGAGTAVADITGNYNGSFVGTPVWGTDAYGANLSGFNATSAVAADGLASSGLFNGTNFPIWIAALVKSTGSAQQQYVVTFGHSSNTTPRIVLVLNITADNQVYGSHVDNAGVQNTLTVSRTRDANYNVFMLVVESASRIRIFANGMHIGTIANSTTGATGFDRFTIGAFRRSTLAVPATDQTISCVEVGCQNVPSPVHVYADLINGQFLGTWSPSSAYSLSAAAGSFSLAGGAAQFALARRLAGAAGSFSLAGGAAGLVAGARLVAEAGAFTLAGNPALLELDAAGSWDGRIPDPNRTTWSRA